MTYNEIKKLINTEEIVDEFINLIKIDSPSYQEDDVADYVISKLKEMGFRVEKLPFTYNGNTGNNIYARKQGELNGKIILGAHMDVVKPCIGIKPIVKDNIITSDGSTVLGGDNKLALAAIIYALKILNRRNTKHSDVELAITAAEEVGVVGARFFDINKFSAKEGAIFDAGGRYGNIVISAPSHDTYKLTVKGISSHAGIEPEKGDNAIIKAGKVIPKLLSGRIDDETVANVGIISGGKATNIVPDEVIINGEIRSFTEEKIGNAKKIINQNISDTLKSSDFTIEWEREYSAYTHLETDPFIHYIANSVEKTGKKPEFFKTGGGSDANAFNLKGIKIVNVSCGLMKPHSLDEFIYIEDLINTACLVITLLTNPKNK